MNTDVAKKLRWKPGMNILLMNAPDKMTAELTPPADQGQLVQVMLPSQEPSQGKPDLLLLFVSSAAELVEWAPLVVKSVAYDEDRYSS